jgi:hypothetical protein
MSIALHEKLERLGEKLGARPGLGISEGSFERSNCPLQRGRAPLGATHPALVVGISVWPKAMGTVAWEHHPRCFTQVLTV